MTYHAVVPVLSPIINHLFMLVSFLSNLYALTCKQSYEDCHNLLNMAISNQTTVCLSVYHNLQNLGVSNYTKQYLEAFFFVSK